MDTLYIWI